MKKYILFILMFASIITSCNEDDDMELADPISFEWLVGEENAQVSRDFDVENSAGFEIMAEINSLCPNTGVVMHVDRDGETLLDSFIVDFPAAFSFDAEGSEVFRVETEIRSITDSEIVCVWLGNAKISGSY